ncbi:MAG: hypothetical protein ACOC5T_03355 [Elusimicrobiota bacterium]
MVYDQQPGTAKLRRTYVDNFIRGFALRNYRFKEALRQSSTNSWHSEFFREKPEDLEAGQTRNVKGIPRGAAFPQAFVKWEKVKKTMKKYGLEQSIPWEDLISSEIKVDARVLLRIARGVVKSVDASIKDTIVNDGDIITFTASENWDGASAEIIDDLEQSEQKIGEYDYSTDELWVYVSPYMKRQVVKYLISKGEKLGPITSEKVGAKNGKIGRLGNKVFIVSNNVDDDECLVLVPKAGGDWESLLPLTTYYNEEPMKDAIVRAAELGRTKITDPKTFVRITGLKA